MVSFSQQFGVIFRKNFLLGWRSREIVYEIILPIVTGVLMVVKDIVIFIEFLTPIIVALAINASTRALLIRLVEEKAERHKETQKIMGLRQSAYFLAWLTSAYVRVFISSVIFVALPILIHTSASVIMNNCLGSGPGSACPEKPVGWWEMFITEKWAGFLLSYFLYFLASVHQAFALSTLFSSSKLAGELGTFLTTLSTLVAYLIFSQKCYSSSLFFIFTSILPQPAVAYAYIIASNQDQYYLMTAFYPNPDSIQWKLYQANIELFVMAVVYFVLYLYLDQVTPNEYGIAKGPLFFVDDIKKFFCGKRTRAVPIRQSQNGENDIQNALLAHGSQIEIQNNPSDVKQMTGSSHSAEQQTPDYSSAACHEPFANTANNRRTVIINSLLKRFGDFAAVNGITFQLYEKQIFCLLGHNGAGKTTTINVLTGMMDKTGGKVEVYGKDLDKDLQEIRESLGICNQRDVLYEDMTFEEHLRFMAEIKGVKGRALDEEVEKIINTTATQDERKKLVKNLSGGNKRKLSLGMALIADSKVVFLDEPTSGMDTVSRQNIWKILDTVRTEKRTIVLTTHHLDEAEILADRICIMAHGKLLALGTNEFIKKNFGSGYNLKVSANTRNGTTAENFQAQYKDRIKKVIKHHLPEAIENPQASPDSVVFIVPFECQRALIGVFEELETLKESVIVNLEMSSLEDAFINIGMDENQFIKELLDKATKKTGTKGDAAHASDKQRGGAGGEEQKEDSLIDNERANGKAAAVAKYTNFDKILAPQCLRNPPVYSFILQFQAIFLRKYYYTFRTLSSYISIIIPLAIMIVGCMIITQIEQFMGVYYMQVLFLSNFLAVGFAFNCGAYVTLPVLERELNLKYALNVMGCRIPPYWAGTFAFDFLLYAIMLIVFFAFSAFARIGFVMMYLGRSLLVLLSFGFSYIPFSYMAGFMFKKSNSALKGFPAFNFFIVFCVPWSVLGVLSLFTVLGKMSESTNENVGYFFNVLWMLVSPLWTFTMGQLLIPGELACVDNVMAWITCKWWVFVLVMFAQGALYLTLTILFEQRRYNLNADVRGADLNNNNNNNDQEPDEDDVETRNGDAGVQRERERVLSDTAPGKIELRRLWKRYENGFKAIKDVTCGVQENEILGLLGPNGAGKSTTFNILTALIPRTIGSVRINDQEVDKGIMNIFQHVGICPQFDCLWMTLTPVEHLFLFGRMKGLHARDLHESVRYFLQTMQLTEFVKTRAGQLSGGNKRKLCVANALIGGPDIQFFDEPSTGVDPIARRFLWNTLQNGQRLRKGSIVLTTHQMQEAETLCQKIGILINGRFRTFGSPQELRNAYGEGFTVTLKLAAGGASKDFLRARMKGFFPNAQDADDSKEDYLTLNVSSSEFEFLKMFRLCEHLVDERAIEDFSITQSSLEQVFVRFSEKQHNQENPNTG